MPKYTVVETFCFPNKWKVVAPPPCKDDNAACNYFADEGDAIRVAEERTKRLEVSNVKS